MEVMFIPDSDKALNHLYRVTKPGGECFIATWHRLEHFEIAERLIRRLRPDQGPLKLWQVPWDDPEYLKAQLAKAGFRDCVVETKLEYILYPGKEDLEFGAEMVPKLYAKLVTLKDGEVEKWNRLWREELQRESYSKEGARMKMWANIARGSK
jgi:SAM-dependent methyltransferase